MFTQSEANCTLIKRGLGCRQTRAWSAGFSTGAHAGPCAGETTTHTGGHCNNPLSCAANDCGGAIDSALYYLSAEEQEADKDGRALREEGKCKGKNEGGSHQVTQPWVG